MLTQEITQEEIEESKSVLNDLVEDENVYNSIKKAVAGTFTYIEQLENKVKEQEEEKENIKHGVIQIQNTATENALIDARSKIFVLEQEKKVVRDKLRDILKNKYIAVCEVEAEYTDYRNMYPKHRDVKYVRGPSLEELLELIQKGE